MLAAVSRRANLWVAAIAVVIGALYAAMGLARFTTFHNETFDLAFYARMAWGLSRGDTWDPIVGANVLGLHLSPVLAPLGLLGRLFGTAQVLLVAQAAAIAAAAWPLARIGARRWGDAGALLGAIAWLAYPNLGHVAAYEAHPGTLAVLPLAWLADGIDRKCARTIVLSSIAVLACREDLGLVVAMSALLAAAVAPESRRVTLGLAAASIAYVAAFAIVLHPRFAPARGSFELHFGKWGTSAPSALMYILGHPAELFAHLTAPRRLLYPLLVLGPLALLPLARARWLLPALPVLAVNLLSDFPTTVNLDSHYLTPVLPFLVAGALDGAARVMARLPRMPVRSALGSAVVVSHVIAAGTPLSFDCPWAMFMRDERTVAAREVVRAVGPDASVQAPYELLAHLAERPALFFPPPPDKHADVVVLDASHRRRFAHSEDLLRTTEEPRTRRWLARGDWQLALAAGDYLVLRRGHDPRAGAGRRYIVGTADPASGTPLTMCLAVLGARLTPAALELELVAYAPCPNDLAVRVGEGPRPRRVDLLFDGLLSPTHLRRGDRLRSTHALSATEHAALVAAGVARVGVLRSSGARPDPADPMAVDVPLR